MKKPALKFTSDDFPGYSRRRSGKGFMYLDEEQAVIRDKERLKRLRSLPIPPAWTQVWISPDPQGHLQATGRDEKGRKQYIYHESWTAYRQASKFATLTTFAEQLPNIRRTTSRHLRDNSWSHRKVLALVVRILDETAIRIGNAVYQKNNKTFGLTTLRRRHMKIEGNRLTFSFKGKSHQYHNVTIENRRLVRIIKDCSELPGYEVFRYLDEEGKPSKVDSREVNAYIQEITDADFSSKDFRTWAGTAAAIEVYEEALQEIAENPRRNLITATVKRVAEILGNTVSVCRKYYIHPEILQTIEERRVPKLEDIVDSLPEELRNYLDDSELIAYHILSAGAR